MTILILGSEGFIGRNAVDYFLKAGYAVIGCDLFEAPSRPYHYIKISRLSPELDELLQKQPVDFFINAAGSGNVNYSVTHPLIDFEANSFDVFKILDALRRLQPSCNYIHISSAAVYGNPSRLPVKEEDTCKPVSPYGYHKWIAELICREFYDIYQQPVAIVRPFSVYGPGLKKQLFWDLLQKYRNGQRPVEVWGTGNESRDFIFIDDLIQSLHCVLQNSPFDCSVYNIGSGTELTIKEAITSMFTELDADTEVYFSQQQREGDPLNWRADISKIKQTGFAPAMEFKTGMIKLVEWYKILS